ncbi:MAG TPA: glutathione S-transferase family protein [Candidatus Binataceae bacterium]|nr:glutathione S-transferase family protein [Candidatus Binataceae bacterium]
MIVLYTTERDYPWGTLRSTHASKTKVVLEEKRIPYRIENLPPGNLWKKPPEMVARHPLGKVPYVEDRGVTIYDSTVIGEYLEDCYSWPALLPRTDPVARAKVRMVEQFVDEAILVGNLPPIWMPYWSEPDKRDKARMEKGREGLRTRDLPYIEQLLGEVPASDFVCGDFSMADVGLMMVAMVLEVDQMPIGGLPRVNAYLERLRARPSYRAISPRTKVAEASALLKTA